MHTKSSKLRYAGIYSYANQQGYAPLHHIYQAKLVLCAVSQPCSPLKELHTCSAGNIDQAQYCDKIKGIVDFLGSKLSVDELTMIWRMQVFVCVCKKERDVHADSVIEEVA